MAPRQGKTDAGKKFHDLFREIFKLQAELSNIMDRVHEEAGLSTAQHKIIRVLQVTGPATVPDTAAHLNVSRQFVQTICNNLHSNGFIEFVDNPRHKRSRLVVLTDKGHAAFQKARHNENQTIAKALKGVDAAKAAEAHDLLKQIRRTVQKHIYAKRKSA